MARQARTEGQVVNREKREECRVNEGIQVEEWLEYFKGSLGGVEASGEKREWD